MVTVTDAAALLRGEFAEIDGLALTPWQAQQLCQIQGDLCDQALRTLVDVGFLRRTVDGRYVRRTVAAGGGLMTRVVRAAR